MKLIRWARCLSTALCTVPSFILAAQLEDRIGSLDVHHRTSQIVDATFGGRGESRGIRSSQNYSIRRDEKVDVIVVDPNPLLFEYRWKGIIKSQNADYSAAVQFATALDALTKVLSPASLRGKAMYLSRADLTRLLSTVPTDRSGKVDVDDIEKALENTGNVSAILGAKGIDDDFLRRFRADLNQIHEWSDSISGITRRTASSNEDTIVKAKEEVANWTFESSSARVKAAFTKLRDAEDALLREGDLDTLSSDEIRSLFLLLLATDQESSIKEVLDSLARFIDLMDQVGKPILLGSISYSASEDQEATIEISLVSNAENARIAKGSSRYVGAFTVRAIPYSAVRLSVGPALVYSFVKKQTFEAKPQGGGFVISRTDDGEEYHAQNIAAMLNITPKRWSDGQFEGGFQVGVSPEKNEKALFLGGRIGWGSVFSYGIGVTYQETPRLAHGLKVGQVLDNVDQLKTTDHYEAGLYLHITVALGPRNQ